MNKFHSFLISEFFSGQSYELMPRDHSSWFDIWRSKSRNHILICAFDFVFWPSHQFIYSMRRYSTISESSIAVSSIFHFGSQFWDYNKCMFTNGVCPLYISDVIINRMMEVYLIIEHEKNPNFIVYESKSFKESSVQFIFLIVYQFII